MAHNTEPSHQTSNILEKKTIKQILCKPKTNKLLHQYKLGPWLIPPKTSHTIFPYYISPTTNAINKIKEQYIGSVFITKHNCTTVTCDGNFYSTDLNDDISPINRLSKTKFQYQHQMLYVKPPSSILRTFEQIIKKIPEYEKYVSKISE